MKSWIRGLARFFLVTFGIVVLTSIGIDATQYFDGSGSALSILTEEALQDSCTEDTVEISTETGAVCVDRFEVSVGEDCSEPSPGSVAATAENVNQSKCIPVSGTGAVPWTQVTYHQAEALCAKAGKRLPTHFEWYRSALGTPDSPRTCNITGSVERTGSGPECVSGKGVYDAVGNVWEWVGGSIVGLEYAGRNLPEEGYVTNADTDGVAIATATNTPSAGFNNDYFWSQADGQFVSMRGGFYGSGADAGLFSIHADMDASFASPAIGFRCAYDLL